MVVVFDLSENQAPKMSKWLPLQSLALCIALGGCLLTDNFDASYDSMAGAIAEGAVRKGWIPAWVPRDATDLREVHNLDTSSSALAFDLPEGTRWQLPADCRPINFRDTVPPSPRRRWWPSDATLAKSYAFHECKAEASPDHTFVGLRADGRHGLHWRAYDPE